MTSLKNNQLLITSLVKKIAATVYLSVLLSCCYKGPLIRPFTGSNVIVYWNLNVSGKGENETSNKQDALNIYYYFNKSSNDFFNEFVP